MSATGTVRCKSLRCGKPIFLSPEDWIALDPTFSDWEGVRVRCPDCGLTFIYTPGDLTVTGPTEVSPAEPAEAPA